MIEFSNGTVYTMIKYVDYILNEMKVDKKTKMFPPEHSELCSLRDLLDDKWQKATKDDV